MQVVPGLDLAGGRLARLTEAGPEPVEAFGGDPLAAAGAFVAEGARRLHVVDVDLAFTGEARNLGVIGSIAALSVPVQASGGVARAEDLAALLEVGADRVVLGSAALADRELVEELAARHGSALAVGVEVDGDRIRARGRVQVDLPLEETLSWLASIHPARILVTAVERVAGMGGPDLDAVRRVAGAVGGPVIAAAGVRSVGDLLALAGIEGVEGAVVGRALLEGGLRLAEAIAAVEP